MATEERDLTSDFNFVTGGLPWGKVFAALEGKCDKLSEAQCDFVCSMQDKFESGKVLTTNQGTRVMKLYNQFVGARRSR